jgi:hypothetical protein
LQSIHVAALRRNAGSARATRASITARVLRIPAHTRKSAARALAKAQRELGKDVPLLPSAEALDVSPCVVARTSARFVLRSARAACSSAAEGAAAAAGDGADVGAAPGFGCVAPGGAAGRAGGGFGGVGFGFGGAGGGLGAADGGFAVDDVPGRS